MNCSFCNQPLPPDHIMTDIGLACPTHEGLRDGAQEFKPTKVDPFVFNDYVMEMNIRKPSTLLVASREDAENQRKLVEFALRACPNLKARIVLRAWIKGWKDIGRKMDVEYGVSKPSKGPSAQQIAKKNKQRAKDAALRAQMRKK